MNSAEIFAITFAITTAVCGFGWGINYNSTKALLFYIKQQGYKMPNKSEIRKYCKKASMDTMRLGKKDFD